MALTILNNIAALAAENQLNVTSNSLNSTLEQLSSGSRINSGADDPAGLAIANGLEANIAALTQSASNATDGVGELQVADGALSQVTTLLDRAVTLATESATGTVSNSQRGAIDTEYQSIKAEIDSIGSTTNFNGGQVFTNNTLNVFLSDGSVSGSSTIGVSTGLLSSTQLTLGGTPATATLGEAEAANPTDAAATLTGGAFVGSTQANATLTAGTNFLAGDTITIGTSVYHIVASGANATAAGDVALQAGGAAASLTNLVNAINAGNTAGTNSTYDLPTNEQTGVTAAASGSNIVLTANVNGTAANSIVTTTGNANETFAGGTLASGTAGIAGSTVTVGATTYTFVTNLSTTATANEIVGGGLEATALTNLVSAVNLTAGAGTTYGTGTAINASASAGSSNGTAVVFTAKSPASGNSYGNTVASTTSGVGSFSNGGTFAGGQAASTVDIGGQTYTFVAAIDATANDVLIGTNAAASLTNLVDAVNNGPAGTGSGTLYATGTALNTTAVGVAGTGTATFTARANGTGGNALVSTTANTVNSFGGTTFANGTNGDSITIGATGAANTYTFVTALSNTIANTANEILVGSTEAVDLANLAGAVNGSSSGGQSAGTTYSTGTVANTYATAASAATAAVFTARTAGVSGNADVATAAGGTGTGGAAEVGTFTTAAGVPTTTFAGGSAAVVAGNAAAAGDTITVGAKTYTFASTINANSAANTVLVGANEGASLTNLAAAVNGATGAGTTYGLNTTANASATAALQPTNGTPTSILFSALQGGVGVSGDQTGNFITSTSTGGDNTFSNLLFTGGGATTNDLLSSADATAALTQINNAVATVAALRGNIGATVNRLQSASAVINNQTQNLTSAENDVTAADIPSTVANLSQYSILEQTGISAIAQANQQQQLVLKLLQ